MYVDVEFKEDLLNLGKLNYLSFISSTISTGSLFCLSYSEKCPSEHNAMYGEMT